MLMKHCSRCYFVARPKKAHCEICGNNTFISSEYPEPETEETQAKQIAKSIVELWQGMKAEFMGGEHAGSNHH
jgi:hypothetical protein